MRWGPVGVQIGSNWNRIAGVVAEEVATGEVLEFRWRIESKEKAGNNTHWES